MSILAGCSARVGSQQERFVPNRPVTGIVYDTATGAMEGAGQAVQTPLAISISYKSPFLTNCRE
jgi:hypothetical protein